jgi:hypothetical protein
MRKVSTSSLIMHFFCAIPELIPKKIMPLRFMLDRGLIK